MAAVRGGCVQDRWAIGIVQPQDDDHTLHTSAPAYDNSRSHYDQIGDSRHTVNEPRRCTIPGAFRRMRFSLTQPDATARRIINIRSEVSGVGLDYRSFNRRSGTSSGGGSQRICLSTQIGSGLMDMPYVLDEPSAGLHPKDSVKMMATLRRLRDIGNTIIVVERGEDAIRAADHWRFGSAW